jgi:hypothetical protein
VCRYCSNRRRDKLAEITDVNWGAIARTGKTHKTKPRNETPPWVKPTMSSEFRIDLAAQRLSLPVKQNLASAPSSGPCTVPKNAHAIVSDC